MASLGNSVVCTLIATSFWWLIGYALARRLVPRALALGVAPVVGWSVHSAATLPLYFWVGFSPAAVIGIGSACLLVAGFSLWLPRSASETEPAATIPVWAFAAAAGLALIPAVTLLPKSSGDATWLADPMFDHAKIAFIDSIARLGLPPVNPVFGATGQAGHLAYYYLWHFSAAEIALITGLSGWDADIGLTWFTAWASLSLMMGVAVWLSKRTGAAAWVVVLAAAGSLWLTLSWIFHTKNLAPVLLPPIGMAGWLFQATWVPQHLMAGSCVVTAMILVTRYALQQSLSLVLIIALIITAGFESSAFVGGITFAFAALVAAPMLLGEVDSKRRLRFVGGLAVAALLVICLTAPFMHDQLAAINARGDRGPVIVEPYRVFGALLPFWLRRTLDIPGYWLVILPVELPATFIAGTIALVAALCSSLGRSEKLAVTVLACLAGAGLVASWLLLSTVGQNNDLGLRAIIAAETVLIVITAAATAGLATRRLRAAIAAIALMGLVTTAPDFVQTIHDNIVAPARPPDANLFAHVPELWAATRRYTAPDARVANNPLFLKDLTPWPVNISWALLANRSSCFAGREMAIAFAALTVERRSKVDATFSRAFSGEGTPDDVHDLATQYGCDVVVLVPQDKAWDRDPFAAAADYRLAEARDQRWRIYVRRK
jgi:hypothetical protein